MTGKVDNPQAFCYGPAEGYRHPDFNKIYTQFLTVEDGENRYFTWVKALNLDETKPYGKSMREQFKWVRRHVDFALWKEDRRAKYWQVDAGFPLESMNNNVYSLEELHESARTLAHKPVNLNHKFPLPTIDVVAAKFEDGVVEAILRIPKNLHCPICDKTKSINDLIESGGIVNVSLEAVCTLKTDDPQKCEGMEFTGLSLLSNATLPGIPLTRLMPLEHIMVEALQVDETNNRRKKRKVKKLKMEVLEQDEEPEKDEHGCVIGKQTWDAEAEKCVPIPPEEQITQVTPVDVPEKPSVEPDEHGQCPEGMRINALGKCVATEECPEAQHWSAEANEGQGGCVPDTTPKPEHPETAVGTAATPKEDVLTDGPTEQPVAGEQPPLTGTKKIPSPPAAGEQPAVTGTSAEPTTPMTPTAPGEIEPKPPHTCVDGEHYDFDVNMCVPDIPITERVKRYQAEDKAKTLRTQVALWQDRYTKLDTSYNKLLGSCIEQRKSIEGLQGEALSLNEKRLKIDGELREEQRETDSLRRTNIKVTKQLTELKGVNEELTKKYHNALSVNLELSRKNTKANEDYLEIAKERDNLRQQIKKAKSIGKKIWKIKV